MTRKRTPLGRILGSLLRYLIATVSLSVVFYIIFALFFSTEEEKRLIRENTLYSKAYPALKEKQRLVGDVVDGLMVRDDTIYRRLFSTPAPALDPVTAADLIADSDSLSDSFYLSSASVKSESLLMMAGNVDDNFREVFRILSEKKALPPLSLPLKDMSYVQMGASVGEKRTSWSCSTTGWTSSPRRGPRSMPWPAERSARSSTPARDWGMWWCWTTGTVTRPAMRFWAR